MKTGLLSILSTGFILLTMTACTPSGGGGGGNDTGKRQFLGELDKAVSEIYGPTYEDDFGKCDIEWKDKALEVSIFLETHREKIDQFYSDNLKNQSQDNFNLIKMGEYTFREAKKRIEGTDAWNEEKSSWADIYENFQKIKDTPIDMNWVWLNSYVRGMIPDEQDRIIYGLNMGLSKDNGPIATAIHEKVQACVNDSTCTNPNISSSEWMFLQQGLGHKWYINRLRFTDKDTYERRREILTKLSRFTAHDKARYEFRPSTIATLNGKILLVPMDLSVFGTEANLFIQYIESTWNNNADYSIQIVPTTNTQDTYTVKADFQVGKRAYVSGREMTLYHLGRTTTFAHEFGHILGFRDNYYTTWGSSTCAYTYQHNTGDVMSVSEKGKVLTRHWDLLKKHYWKQ